jgi:hypothetical protein
LVPALVRAPAISTGAPVIVRLVGGLVIEADNALVSPAWLASLLGELSRK